MHGTRTTTPAVRRRSRHDRAVADLPHHRGRPQPRRRRPAPSAGAPSPSCFGSSGTACRRRRTPRAPRRRAACADAHLALDAIDPERLAHPALVLEADDVPEPVPRQQAVRIERHGHGRGTEAHGRPARAFASNRLARAGGDGSAATSGAASPSSASPAQLQQARPPASAAEPDRGHRQLQGVALLRREVEVGQLVGGPVDPVTGRAGCGRPPAPAARSARRQLAQLGLVALERAPPRRLTVGVLAGQLVGDLLEGQRLVGLEQQGQQVRSSRSSGSAIGPNAKRYAAGGREASITRRMVATTSSAVAPGVSTAATPGLLELGARPGRG